MTLGQFRLANDIASDPIPIGSLKWICHPASTGARQLTVVEAKLNVGDGHAFHMHPEQEEMIHVTGGQVEQWIGEEKRLLLPGDSVFIPAGVPHASFTIGNVPARLLAIFGPSVGAGFTTVELAEEAPWKDILARKAA